MTPEQLPLFDSVKPNNTYTTCSVCGGPTGQSNQICSSKCERKLFSKSEFDGITYEPKFDADRLRGAMGHVYEMMKDGKWHTINEIASVTNYSPAGISARIRDFRKKRFGNHTVNRRRRGDPKRGLFEYQLL